VRLENNSNGLFILVETIKKHYQKTPRTRVQIFDTRAISDPFDGYYVNYLLNGKHVVKYHFYTDRRMLVGILSLGIGPHYFFPEQFAGDKWLSRFTTEPTVDAINKNLSALDAYLSDEQS
jgi:hypothetical protein